MVHLTGFDSRARHRAHGDWTLERDWLRCHARSGACLQHCRSRLHRTVSSRASFPDELPNSCDNREGSVAIPCVPIRGDSTRLNPIHLPEESDAYGHGVRRKNPSSAPIPSPAASRARPVRRIGVQGGHVIWWRGLHLQRPKTVPPPYLVPLHLALYDGSLPLAIAGLPGDGHTASNGVRLTCEARSGTDCDGGALDD
jgi:hypothetical protein